MRCEGDRFEVDLTGVFIFAGVAVAGVVVLAGAVAGVVVLAGVVVICVYTQLNQFTIGLLDSCKSLRCEGGTVGADVVDVVVLAVVVVVVVVVLDVADVDGVVVLAGAVVGVVVG